MPDVGSRFTSREYLEELAAELMPVYRQYLRFFLRAATQDGLVVGQEPSRAQEAAEAIPTTLPWLLQVAQDPNQPEGMRARAQNTAIELLNASERANGNEAQTT